MWIRSQSKETLLNATKIYIQNNEIFANMEDGFDEMVGEYISKERAIEVLGEIQEYLIDILDKDVYVIPIYEMPEE